MADRVSASITLGGIISPTLFAELAELVAAEGLSIEWDGEPFEPAHRIPGEPLRLYAHEVPWGRFDRLENWCVANGIAFARWAGGYPGEWTAERVVFAGTGAPHSFTADEDDRIYIDRSTVEHLGSVEAILAHFDAADATVPPLILEGEPFQDP
ncbi:hypothetical protein [Sphingosinicella rhizophila]|uniref:Uncharacterized protein n=1 Tax=Sphingosinicella rhizophila TaxID=3050082 RepID=A0ABU3QAJ9_9SPHN|nr:hypothetical protein [Sphingosinicella sp. GR2756]MDT9600431.1 hypothetical protein [Sphingosinicella sp. GR2756]